MGIALTAVFRKEPECYIAFVEELPGANTQGATLEEARENLREAVELILKVNRTRTLESAKEKVAAERVQYATFSEADDGETVEFILDAEHDDTGEGEIIREPLEIETR